MEVAIAASNISSFLMCQESYWDEQVYCHLRLCTGEMIDTGTVCELNAKENNFYEKIKM